MRPICYRAVRKLQLHQLCKTAASGATALSFHGVEPSINDPLVEQLHMPTDVFEEQIRYLSRNFDIISLDDLSELLSSGKRISSRHIVLTFDDGYRNNLHVAAPILQANNAPFAVFVSTRHVDQMMRFPIETCLIGISYTEQQVIELPSIGMTFRLDSTTAREHAVKTVVNTTKLCRSETIQAILNDIRPLLSDDRWKALHDQFRSNEPMSWDEIRAIQKMGATVGSHCHDHAILHKDQDPGEILRQLTESKAILEHEAGSCHYFAFPNGDPKHVADIAVGLVEQAGYRLGFSTVPGEISTTCNRHYLPRICAPFDIDALVWNVNLTWRHNRRYRSSIEQFGFNGSSDR